MYLYFTANRSCAVMLEVSPRGVLLFQYNHFTNYITTKKDPISLKDKISTEKKYLYPSFDRGWTFLWTHTDSFVVRRLRHSLPVLNIFLDLFLWTSKKGFKENLQKPCSIYPTQDVTLTEWPFWSYVSITDNSMSVFV